MFTKLVRIGRDADLRYTPNNKAVVGLVCVYDIGFGDNKKAQWLEATIWGKQAEGLAQYLTKGKQVAIYADDVQIETYEHNGKTGSKLKCRVINIDLTDNSNGSRTGQNAQQQAPQQAPRQQAPQQQSQQQANGFNDDFSDDIPF